MKLSDSISYQETAAARLAQTGGQHQQMERRLRVCPSPPTATFGAEVVRTLPLSGGKTEAN